MYINHCSLGISLALLGVFLFGLPELQGKVVVDCFDLADLQLQTARFVMALGDR